MGGWFKFIFVIVGLFLPLSTIASPEKDWVEVYDPREFVPECSLENSTEMSFAEVAENYEDLIGSCVKVSGYYSGASYDDLGFLYKSIEGYVETNGDSWFGVHPEIILKNRLGLYWGGEIDPYFLEFPKTSEQFGDQMDFWDENQSINELNLRKVVITGSVFSCEAWERELKRKGETKDPYFIGFCHYGQGPFLLLAGWEEVGNDAYDPLLDLDRTLLDENWKLLGPDNFDEAKNCTLENSEEVKFRDLALHPAKYLNQCVRVKGFSWGFRNFYDGIEGYYKTQKLGYNTLHPYQIGLYLIEAQGFLDDKLFSEQMVSEVAGWVDTCEHAGGEMQSNSDRSEQGHIKIYGEDENTPINLTMFAGYCHYDGGTYLVVSNAKSEEIIDWQITGEENRGEFGNLSFAPKNWEFKNRLEVATTHWLRERLLDFDKTPGKYKNSPLGLFSEKINKNEELDEAILLEITSPYYPESLGGNSCFCLEDSCKGKWPISHINLFYKPGKPYMCVFFSFENESFELKPQWAEEN